MTRFERTTRILILVLWGLAFVFFLLVPWLRPLWEPPVSAEWEGPVQLSDAMAAEARHIFFVDAGGAVAAVGIFALSLVLGRRALVRAFRELSYPQYSILTVGVAFGLPILQARFASPTALFLLLGSPPEQKAFLAGLNMLSVFFPCALAVVALGWPWRLVPQSGLIASTCGCIAYILWSYFFCTACAFARYEGSPF